MKRFDIFTCVVLAVLAIASALSLGAGVCIFTECVSYNFDAAPAVAVLVLGSAACVAFGCFISNDY